MKNQFEAHCISKAQRKHMSLRHMVKLIKVHGFFRYMYYVKISSLSPEVCTGDSLTVMIRNDDDDDEKNEGELKSISSVTAPIFTPLILN